MIWEMSFLQTLRDISNEFLDFVFEAITFLGEQYILIVIMVVLFFGVSKKLGERMIYSVFLSILVNGSVKVLVQRPRPFNSEFHGEDAIIPAREETATGFSFPSGHSQNAAVVYTGSALVIKKKWAYIVAPIIFVLIGFSRLWLGVHYPTDVIAGLCLGVAIAILGATLIEKVENNYYHKLIVYGVTALVFLPFLFIYYPKIETTTNGYTLYKDLFVSYGLYIGFVGANVIDHFFVNFTDTSSIKLKIIRIVGSLGFMGVTYVGLKLLFGLISDDSALLDMLRYLLVGFMGLGIFPLVTKKWFFKKEETPEVVKE